MVSRVTVFLAVVVAHSVFCQDQMAAPIADEISNDRSAISSIAALQDLSDEQADEGHDVRIVGVVLSIDSDWRGVFLQDGDFVAYINYAEIDSRIVPGSRASVAGESKSGIVTPVVVGATLEYVGDGGLPKAIELTGGNVHDVRLHNHLVRVAGEVDGVTVADTHSIVRLAFGDEVLVVKVRGMLFDHPCVGYRGPLELTGVLSRHVTDSGDQGVMIHVPTDRFVDWPDVDAIRRREMMTRLLLCGVCIAACLSAFVFAWVVSLRRSVTRRTAQLTSVQDAVDTGIVVVSSRFRLLSINQQAEGILVGARVGEDFRPHFESLLARATDGTELSTAEKMMRVELDMTIRSEIEIDMNDGKATFRVFSAPIESTGQPMSGDRIWSFTNITGMRELERRVQQSEKMQALGTLAGGVAHDFNNLLTAISTNLDLARMDPESSEKSIEAASEAANRGAFLVRQLLSVSSQRNVVVAQSCDVGDTLRLVAELLQPIVEPEIRVEFESDRDLHVPLDATQLEEVLLNLIYNAVGAVGDSGTIQVVARTYDSICAEQLATEQTNARQWKGVQLEPNQSGTKTQTPAPVPMIVIEVSDDGTGIPLNVQSRVFEPFFTTKATGKGSGLGLSTSYGIVTSVGGEMVLQSTPGHGSRFTILLPRVLADSRRLAKTVEPRPVEVSCDRTHVLVVDDEEIVRTAISRALLQGGCETTLANSGLEALAILDDAGFADIDCVVLDLSMPGMSGRETLSEIRRICPGLPVVICSGYSVDLSNLQMQQDDDKVLFLAKPFRLPELLNAVGSMAIGRENARVAM